MSDGEQAFSLPRRPEAVSEGRAALAPYRDALGDRWEDVRLLVSELLTNAVLHGQGEEMRVMVRVTGGRCRVEVIDGGHGFEPVLDPPAPEVPGGRGLLLVDAISQDWGVYEGCSTHVWFELEL